MFASPANQSTTKALNDTLVQYGFGQDWSNAYEAVKLPDALSGVRQALQVAFGRDVRPVAPTAAKFEPSISVRNRIIAAGQQESNSGNDEDTEGRRRIALFNWPIAQQSRS